MTCEATDCLVRLIRICISLKSASLFKERDVRSGAELVTHAVDTQLPPLQETRPDFPLGLGQVSVVCSYPPQPPGGARAVHHEEAEGGAKEGLAQSSIWVVTSVYFCWSIR